MDVGGTRWAWAYPLVNMKDVAGYLVVSCDIAPEPHHHFLLNVLVQQADVALVNASWAGGSCRAGLGAPAPNRLSSLAPRADLTRLEDAGRHWFARAVHHL